MSEEEPPAGPWRQGSPWCDLEDWFLFMMAVHDGMPVSRCAEVLAREERCVGVRITALKRTLKKPRNWEERDL